MHIKQKESSESCSSFESSELNSLKSEEKSFIVEVQINKGKFNGQEVKLILVRSIDYMIKKQEESFRFKNDKVLQEIYWNELLGPLNTIASQARLLIDNKKMLTRGESSEQVGGIQRINKSLQSIWS